MISKILMNKSDENANYNAIYNSSTFNYIKITVHKHSDTYICRYMYTSIH